ncbi:YczE/YyaS/YitT family protein [Microbacterium sp. YY-01]|uniref:membrane protein YczE n=1 Tax=Microbacterium sp. YY-01 TaxID=3421634 RepID=UPI003D17086C
MSGWHVRRPVRRFIQLFVGLFLYGVGIAFILRAELGAAPWDVLAQGLSLHIPLTFGMVTIVISGLVLVMWLPLRQKMGLGTILNALLVGPSADIALLVLPTAESWWLRGIFLALGITVLAAATGLYIGAQFGPGPRDGLMTGLHDRTGWPIWVVRTGLEVTVVVIGWLLGGTAGVGTIAFALLIGPLCQFFMRIFAVRLPQSPDATAAPTTG